MPQPSSAPESPRSLGVVPNGAVPSPVGIRAHRMRHVVAALALPGLIMLAAAPSAEAQVSGPGRTLVSINPLGLPFKYVSGELEQRLNGIVTLGGSLSFIGIDDASYASFEGKLRLYPNEEAFRGFSIGLSAGLSRVAESYRDRSDRSEVAPTIGVIADYNWLLGRTKRVMVGTGLGAKRIFGNVDNFGDVNLAYPTARFQVGVIF